MESMLATTEGSEEASHALPRPAPPRCLDTRRVPRAWR